VNDLFSGNHAARVIWKPTYDLTVRTMFEMARAFRRDVLEFLGPNPYEMYNYIRDLPFIDDPPEVETLARPAFILSRRWLVNRDCDDKSLAIGAWCEQFRYRYRFAVVGENLDHDLNPHHVYPEIWLEKNWVPFDATYPDCKLGERLYTERFRRIFYPA